MVHESARTVIDGLARDRGVVGVHDAVDETDQQPARDQFGLPHDHGLQQRVIGTLGIRQLRIMPVDDMIRQPPHTVGIAARGKVLERADADVAGGHSREHRPWQHRLAHYVFARDHGGKRSRGGNAKCGHRLADDVFA